MSPDGLGWHTCRGGVGRAVGRELGCYCKHPTRHRTDLLSTRTVLPQNVSGVEIENLALKNCLAVARRVSSQAQCRRGVGVAVVSEVRADASARAVRWGREEVGIPIFRTSWWCGPWRELCMTGFLPWTP